MRARRRGGRTTRRAVGALAVLGVLAAGGGALAGAGRAASPPPPLVAVHVRDGLVQDRAVGVVVAPGRVLTVAHVLGEGARAADAAERVRVAGAGTTRVLRVDRSADLALLAVAGVRGPTVALAPAATAAPPGMGARTTAVRVELPEGVRRARATRHVGTVEDVLGRDTRRPVLRLATAGVRSGDSGSPVLDGRRRLAGIVFATDRHADVAWATAAPALRRILR